MDLCDIYEATQMLGRIKRDMKLLEMEHDKIKDSILDSIAELKNYIIVEECVECTGKGTRRGSKCSFCNGKGTTETIHMPALHEYGLKIQTITRTNIDRKRLIELVGEEEINKCLVTTSYRRLDVIPK